MAELLLVGNSLTFNGKSYSCAIGRAGFGKTAEGDGKTPLGTYFFRECWYRTDRVAAPRTDLPLKIIRDNDGWCDDPKSPEYNKHVTLPFAAPHEKLWRDDHQYDLIIPLSFNDEKIIPGRGSAIFIHVAKPDYGPTEGCIALAKHDLFALLPHLGTKSSIAIKP